VLALTLPALSGRQVLVLVGIGVVVAVLLWLPVLGDRIMDYLSKNAPKYAPRIFFAGLGLLLLGVVAGLQPLEVAGGCLIGALVLGALVDNY
jgi:hypothetical protein